MLFGMAQKRFYMRPSQRLDTRMLPVQNIAIPTLSRCSAASWETKVAPEVSNHKYRALVGSDSPWHEQHWILVESLSGVSICWLFYRLDLPMELWRSLYFR
jgi:hypothetical protein